MARERWERCMRPCCALVQFSACCLFGFRCASTRTSTLLSYPAYKLDAIFACENAPRKILKPKSLKIDMLAYILSIESTPKKQIIYTIYE